ncbi:MAG: hypothetical protein MR787_07990 [Bacteroidales bacterium]|nr:hypothetical protein [Bacteroidales bacterium]
MATVTLTFNDRNQLAHRTLEYIMSLGVFKATYKQPSAAEKKTMQALQEAHQGKLTQYENFDDFAKAMEAL